MLDDKLTPVTRRHRLAVVGPFFHGRKVSAGQFGTLATKSALKSPYGDAADISPGMIAPEALPVVIDHPPFKIS